MVNGGAAGLVTVTSLHCFGQAYPGQLIAEVEPATPAKTELPCPSRSTRNVWFQVTSREERTR